MMNDWATNVNGGRIPVETLQHLLSSQFDNLNNMALDLSFNDRIFEYSLPLKFLKCDNIKKLNQSELPGNFIKGTKDKLAASVFFNNRIVVLDVEEPETEF